MSTHNRLRECQNEQNKSSAVCSFLRRLLHDYDCSMQDNAVSGWESGNCFLVNSRILGFGIRNSAQGIRNPANKLEGEIQVLLTRNPEFISWNPESTAWNSELSRRHKGTIDPAIEEIIQDGAQQIEHFLSCMPERKGVWSSPEYKECMPLILLFNSLSSERPFVG